MVSKARIALGLGVILGASTASAGRKIDPALKDRLDQHFKGKDFAVLVQDGVPSRAKGSGLLDQSVTIQIKNGGPWKQKSFLGIKDSDDISAMLNKGELLRVKGYKTVKNGLNVVVDTVKSHDIGAEWKHSYKNGKSKSRYSNKFDYLRTELEFRFDEEYLTASEDNFNVIVGAVEMYMKCFATDAEAMSFAETGARQTAEVKLGMSEEEVKTALGAPRRRVDLGDKVTLLYDDMTVVLREGKVADVEFK